MKLLVKNHSIHLNNINISSIHINNHSIHLNQKPFHSKYSPEPKTIPFEIFTWTKKPFHLKYSHVPKTIPEYLDKIKTIHFTWGLNDINWPTLKIVTFTSMTSIVSMTYKVSEIHLNDINLIQIDLDSPAWLLPFPYSCWHPLITITDVIQFYKNLLCENQPREWELYLWHSSLIPSIAAAQTTLPLEVVGKKLELAAVGPAAVEEAAAGGAGGCNL